MVAAGSTRSWPLVVVFFVLSLLISGAVSSSRAHPLDAATQETKVDFERHVMGLLGRMGCNSGSCHGSFQGKGNLRLSLFGYDPEKDHQALTRDSLGRRINRVDPDQSLLLQKPSGQVQHG